MKRALLLVAICLVAAAGGAELRGAPPNDALGSQDGPSSPRSTTASPKILEPGTQKSQHADYLAGLLRPLVGSLAGLLAPLDGRLPPVPEFVAQRGWPYLVLGWAQAPPITLNLNLVQGDMLMQDMRARYWPKALCLMALAGALAVQLVFFLVRMPRLLVQRCSIGGYGKILPTEPCEEPEEKTSQDSERWVVGGTAVLVSAVCFYGFVTALCVAAVAEQAVSSRSGLAWEVWAVFLAYNVCDAVVQSAMCAWFAPKVVKVVMDKALLMNAPLVSAKIDFTKDLVFLALVLRERCYIIAALATIILVAVVIRHLFNASLRLELRGEFFPLLKPCVERKGMFDREMSRDEYIWAVVLLVILGKSVDATTSIKMDSALCEDLPQAVLQSIFTIGNGGSAFVVFSVVVSVLKLVGIFFMFFVLAFMFTCDGGSDFAPREWFNGHARSGPVRALRYVCPGPFEDLVWHLGQSRPLVLEEDVVGDTLAELLCDQHLGVEVRHAVVRAMSNIGGEDGLPERAIRALESALSDEDKVVGCAAAQAIGVIAGRITLGETTTNALVEKLGSDVDPWLCCAAAESLGSIGKTQTLSQDAVEALTRALGDERVEVRCAVAEAMCVIGRVSAIPQDAICAFERAAADSGSCNTQIRARAALEKIRACDPGEAKGWLLAWLMGRPAHSQEQPLPDAS